MSWKKSVDGPGYYWARHRETAWEALVKVEENSGKLQFFLHKDSTPYVERGPGMEWNGPLKPPED